MRRIEAYIGPHNVMRRIEANIEASQCGIKLGLTHCGAQLQREKKERWCLSPKEEEVLTNVRHLYCELALSTI